MASILVIEDQVLIATATAMILEDAGHEVVGMAGTVREALDVARRSPPDLALVDIGLAGRRSGVDAARELGGMGVPSVFVTSHRNLAKANTDSALGLLPKPCSGAGLVAAVDAALELARGGTPRSFPREMVVFQSDSN